MSATASSAASIFVADSECFVPTEHARGPWDPNALHGGAPAALIASAFERVEPGRELVIGRLSFELLRPVPMAPLTLATSIVRPGRRVQELSAELSAGDQLIARASALRVQPVPGDAAREARPPSRVDAPMPGPDEAEPLRFALDGDERASFAATAMEMRSFQPRDGVPPGRVWMRLRHPLLPGEPLSPLARLAATADFGNGVSAALPFDRFLFINADLTVHLERLPRGEWIGLDARTLVCEDGAGTAEGVLHDVDGPVGRAFQTLVVQLR